MLFCGCSSLTILPKKFRQKSICIFCSKCESDEENVFFSKKRQKILLELLNSVLISLLEIIAESPKFFFSKSGNGKKIYFLFPKKSCSKCSLGQKECLFDNPDEVFLPRSQNILRSMN